MRACGQVLCVIFSIIHLIYTREYARPSPTDMPYSQRDILNKKQNMKTYIKNLKSFKLAPRLAGNETEGVGHLLVEGEKIRIPSSASGLSEVTKIYLDQNKLRRYLRILDVELERTTATIELDPSKIIDYLKMLNKIDKHQGKSADLLSRSRIKLMKSGRIDNLMYNRRHLGEAGFFDGDFLVDKRDRVKYSTVDENGLSYSSDVYEKKPEESIEEYSGSQHSDYPDLDPAKSARDIEADQYLEGENYVIDSELNSQLLDRNTKQLDNDEKTLPENIIANKFNGDYMQPFDQEYIDSSQIQIKPPGVTETSGIVSAKGVNSYLEDPVGKEEETESGNNNEKSGLSDWTYEYEKNKDLSLFDSPFELPVPFKYVTSKDYGTQEEIQGNINDEKEVDSQDLKLQQHMTHAEMSYENAKILEPSGGVYGSGAGGRIVKDIKPQRLGAILNSLLNKLLNMEKPVNKLSQVADTSASISNLNNQSFNQQYTYNGADMREGIETNTAVFLENISMQNLSSTESSLIWNGASNGSPDHKIFPLKPEDEIMNVPKMKYFEKCFEHQKNAMPTKPPKMFSKYYISKLKKFENYNDDSGTQNFLKEPRFPLFGTKENEVSKILNVNLDHLHIDKGALFKIIGKALKIDEENPQDYAPPKWLEDKYDELLHASHRGQNFNDYDYIEKSRHLIFNDRFNIRNRKKSVLESNNTNF